MDNRLLEFWGNYWLQMAQGKMPWGEIFNWWQKGLAGFNEMNPMGGKAYGLNPPELGFGESQKVWEETLRMFQKSFQEYLNLLGYVPRADYDRLQTDYEQLQNEHQILQKKAEIQEETIHQLQTLLAAKTVDPAGLAAPFGDLISKQTEQFQRLMTGMMATPKKPSTEEDEGQ